MKMYNVVAYHGEKRFCVVMENVTLETATAYINSKEQGKNDWYYFTEEVI